MRKPFENIDAKIKQVIAKQLKDDPVLYLENTLKELQNVKPYNELGEKLYPLYGWRRELGKGIQQVLELVAEALESGNIFLENSHLKKVNDSNIELLKKNLKRLIDLGYTASVARNGETREARTDEEKNKLKQLNEELNELSIHLNIVMKDVLEQISRQEIDRMYQAVVELFNCHLFHLEKGANNIAPNMVIKLPESQLNQVRSELSFNLSFESGFIVTEGTWEEETRSFWHWFWIVPKFETRFSENAKIPSVERLLGNWNIQVKLAEPNIVKQITSWLLEQIDCLKKNVDKIQNDIIDRYQARLDKANQEIDLDYEKQKNVWRPMQQKAQELVKEFFILAKPSKKEL